MKVMNLGLVNSDGKLREKEKQMDFMPFNCVGRPCLVFPFQNSGSLTVFVLSDR